MEISLRIADAVADPAVVAHAVAGTPLERFISRGLGGWAGMALFYGAVLQVCDVSRYREALHAYMKLAAESRWAPVGGLFVGIGGVAAASAYASIVEERYRGLASRSAAALVALQGATGALQQRRAETYADFDLISGVAGQTLALAAAKSQTEAACDYLAWLLDSPERWAAPHPVRNAAPENDLGLAHGLSGMLAALCSASPPGAGYDEVISRGAQFLRQAMGDRLGWPAFVGGPPVPGPGAWCYGTPGCASAIITCAGRTGDARHLETAISALRSSCLVPESRWSLADYAICHGRAGNALVMLALGALTSDGEISAAGEALIDGVIAGFDADAPFGYRSRYLNLDLDSGTLLTGAAGVALVLLTATGRCDPSWMAFLGLTPVKLALD